ncbi:unnamed protein product [Rhizophagus irregularis]|nr:unnamed protein product [Rhizophagus irregularis]
MDFRKSILRFVSSGGLPKNGKPKDSFGRASEERKPKDSRSGGLLKKEKPRNQDSIWWASEERKTKKPRNVQAGFCVEKPRFDRVEWASDLWEKKNQDSSRVSQVSSEEQKKPKIRKFGWIAKEQSKIRIYEYMNHVIVELYLN